MAERPVCAGLWETPMVHVNGDLTTCCLDEHLRNRLGNVMETPLAELWNGPLLKSWRIAQAEGRFSESGPYCNACNWRSAGAMPDNAVEAWLQKHNEQKALARFRALRKRP